MATAPTRARAVTSKRVRGGNQNMNRGSQKMLTLAVMLGAGESAFAADLISIYREAQVQDATYAGAKAQYIGAQEKLPQARALLRPNVNFSAGTHYNGTDSNYPSKI